VRKYALIILAIGWFSASHGAWESIDAVATRTAIAYSPDRKSAVGLTCFKGQINSLKGFVFFSLPPSQAIDFEMTTSSPGYYLLATGYGFFDSQTSWIDRENLEEFLELLKSDSTLNIVAQPSSSSQDWPNELVATIDIRNTARVIGKLCNQ